MEKVSIELDVDVSNALEEIRNIFAGSSDTEELFQCVQELIPLEHDRYKIKSVNGKVTCFKAHVQCDIKSVTEVEKFVGSYMERSNETLRKLTPKRPGAKSIYEVIYYYRCHFKTYHQPTMNHAQVIKAKPNKRFKNTDCPFSLAIKLRKDKDNEHPCDIEIEHQHNHSNDSLQSLTFKDISPDVCAKIKEMFDRGLTPGLAYREMLHNVKQYAKNDIQLHINLADRSKMPRRRDFNNLYTQFHREKFGSENLETMFNCFEERISNFKANNPDHLMTYQRFEEKDDTPFIFCLLTPLMKRVHEQVKTSAELAFLDSSSNMEEFNLRVFLMVCHNPIGALPLGIIITSDETTDTLVRALDMFISILPKSSFFGRGNDAGPKIIMTDNCSELRDALKHAWPNAILLFCSFHILQQVWRWLFEKKHNVAECDRQFIMNAFKAILYERSIYEFESKFEEFREDEIVSNHVALLCYMENLYEMRGSWAHCYRKNLIIRGNNTNNPVEAQFLVLKDSVLLRQKEININGLLDKLLEDFNEHYKVKLLNVASGSFDGVYPKLAKMKKKVNLTNAKLCSIINRIEKIGISTYKCPSFEKAGYFYFIGTDIGVCSCPVGVDGSPCKHQYVIWAHVDHNSSNFLPFFSAEDRKNYASIAIGESLPIELYAGIHGSTELTHVATEPPPADQNSSTDLAIPDYMMIQNDQTYSSRNHTIDVITPEECKIKIQKAAESLIAKIDQRSKDTNFLTGVSKFCDRIEKLPTSRLASAFHSFAGSSVESITAGQVKKVTKSKRGKIHVGPEAVKRRKKVSGSRSARVKGMTVKNNPFELKQSKKREHCFSKNVNDNVAVPRKARKFMASKTQHPTKRCSTTSSTDSISK